MNGLKDLKLGKPLATAHTDELVFRHYRSYPASYWVTLNSVGSRFVPCQLRQSICLIS